MKTTKQSKLMIENSNLKREVEDVKRSSAYWQQKHSELDERVKKQMHANNQLECIAMNRNSVIEAAAIRAVRELQSVQNSEKDVVALHRVIGSIQGGLCLALENTGSYHCEGVDLSPKKNGS